MRLLLDTHIWLWLLTEPNKLPAATLKLLADENHALYLSAASAWEIAIKYALGKLPLPSAPQTYVPSRMTATGVSPLEVNVNHALAVADLEPHHRDPFDRLIITQARMENMTVLTADQIFNAYGIETIRPTPQ